MRTTLILSDNLIVEAKRIAAERRQSLSAVVNEALRKSLFSNDSMPQIQEFRMPTYRPVAGTQYDLSPESQYDLIAADETTPYRL